MKMTVLVSSLLLSLSCSLNAAEITRYGGGSFPIAAAVEVDGIVYESGKVPQPKDPAAEKFSKAYWGDTEAQTISVMERIKESLESKGMSISDIVKMTAFLVGDPELDGKMDFAGFMRGYTQYFGEAAKQPNLPARSTVQIAGLVQEGMLVEIEVIAVRPKAK
jgi:enamine deaminase RidA (YjgF/YER057c/UK114 family)